jgi:hypothetical protein
MPDPAALRAILRDLRPGETTRIYAGAGRSVTPAMDHAVRTAALQAWGAGFYCATTGGTSVEVRRLPDRGVLRGRCLSTHP